MSYHKDKDDKAVHDNKVIIKNYFLRSLLIKNLELAKRHFHVTVLAFRGANVKTCFLHYDIYMKILCTALNLSFTRMFPYSHT